jgi:hypothetical protein
LQPAAREGFGSPDSDSGWVTSNPHVDCRPGGTGLADHGFALVRFGLVCYLSCRITVSPERGGLLISLQRSCQAGVSRVSGALARPMLFWQRINIGSHYCGAAPVSSHVPMQAYCSSACATRSFSPEPAGWFCRVLRFPWSCARAATRS